jgi:S-adenosylmethionine-dependent methyltransferase
LTSLPESIGPADFASAIPEWRSRLGLVRDVVRQEVVHRQLLRHLSDPSGAAGRVLDIGCGQGTQVVRLALSGFDVTGLDPSSELLSLAGEAVALAGPEVAERVTLKQGSLDDWPSVGANFDAVCCHGVVMYVPSLEPVARQLVAAARVGGLISVLAKNQPNLVLRAALKEDWGGALDAFDARYYTNRLGVVGARSDEPEEMAETFRSVGAETVAWYGVRLFTDHWDDVVPPSDIETILEVEEEAGRRDPYRRLASFIHLIARRR